jgi:hypothetical protein
MTMIEVTENYSVKLLLEKIQQIRLIKGKTSGRVSLQMIVHTLYCIKIDTPVTIILFCINSALYHSFLPPNHISKVLFHAEILTQYSRYSSPYFYALVVFVGMWV